MSIQEEINELNARLQQTTGLEEQAELILGILKNYTLISSKEGAAQIQQLKDIAAELNNNKYLAWSCLYRGSNHKLAGSYNLAIHEIKEAVALFGSIHYNPGLVVSLNTIGTVYYEQGNYPQALASHLASLKANEENPLPGGHTEDKQGEASSYNNIANIHYSQGKYDEALSNYLRALKLYLETGNEKGIASLYNNIGSLYYHQGNLPEALANHFAALKIREKMGDRQSVAASYNNIATVYYSQENHDEALSNYQLSLKMYDDIGDRLGIATTYNNIGLVYKSLGKYTDALYNITRALDISTEIGDTYGKCYSYNSIGDVYYSQGNYEQALQNQLNALKISEDIGEQHGIARAANGIGCAYTALGNYKIAAAYLEKGLKIAAETGYKEEVMNALKGWYELKKTEGDGMAALAYYEQYVTQQKELMSQETARKVAGIKFGFEVDKKEKELEIEQLRNVELKHERDRAERSEKFKEQFLANMSHEIRTPMNAVLGMTNLLLNTPLNEKQKNYLNAVKKSSENLLVILNDILYLAKLEAGKMALENVPFNLADQVNHVVALLDFKAAEKGLLFTTEIADNVPAFVVGDAPRLNQVLINLIGNAIKFTQYGFVKLTVAGNTPTYFSISDSGIGMSAEQQGRIFESFMQAENDTVKKYGGTGLGLSISKTLIELQGGSIEVKSEMGKGSEFSFSLFYPEAKQADIAVIGKPTQAHYAALSKLKVLVAEDDYFNQVVIKDTLEDLLPGIQVEIVKNGKELIEKPDLIQYGLILLDVQMPGMDGYETSRYIRQVLKSNIPILALTASVISNDIDKCMAAGMNGYIPKPFTHAELLNALMKHVGTALTNTTNTTGNIDLSYLKNFTGGNPKSILKYINMFLLTAPPLVEKTELALNLCDADILMSTLHTLKPHLKFMGLTEAETEAALTETLLIQHKVVDDEIKNATTQMCLKINKALIEFNYIKKDFA